MSDTIVKWIKILVVFILLMFMVQTYFVNQHFKKNLITTMVQTNSSMETIRKWMSSNPSDNMIETVIGNKSTLPTSKSLEHEKVIVQNESKVKEAILTFKGSQIPGESSLTSPPLIRKGIVIRQESSKVNNISSLQKPLCSRGIGRQAGRIRFNFTSEKYHTREKTNFILNKLSRTVVEGGRYQPPNCESRERVAIIIPYRDREQHLKIFLRHMHPFLQRQKLEYGIFVIELDKNITFNRAILMNIGFVEALKLHNYTCFVFHDVDLLPEDDRIPYSCARNPQHLSVAVNTLNYTLPTKNQFGGVSALRTKQFITINGMSNMFFGWGGEDDDLSARVRSNKYNISRPPEDVARYTMIGHVKDPDRNPQRRCLLKSVKERMDRDGLLNLKYERVKFELKPLNTWVLVRVNEADQLRSDSYLFKFYEDCVKEVQNKGNGIFLNHSKPLLVIAALLCYILKKSYTKNV